MSYIACHASFPFESNACAHRLLFVVVLACPTPTINEYEQAVLTTAPISRKNIDWTKTEPNNETNQLKMNSSFCIFRRSCFGNLITYCIYMVRERTKIE